jgi:glycosyltransferase involved in cell wall biosynthesis
VISLRETCSERKLFISDLLVASPEEGGQMLAGLLKTHFSECHGYTTIADRTSELGTGPAIHGWWLGMRLLGWIWVRRPTSIVYMPKSGLTLGALVRIMILRGVAPWAAIEMVLTQVHLGSRWWKAAQRWVRTLDVRPRVATEEQRALLDSADTRLLTPRVHQAKISTLSRDQARRRSGLPLDGLVFLHVGHAKRNRNLHVLADLATRGRVVIALSGVFEEEPGSLPSGPNIEFRRGRQDLATLYRAASVYVFPTCQADAVIGIPMSVMEAHANGTPVVAMRSDSMRRWTGMTDVHIADGDAEFLAIACQVADSRTISARSRGLRPESCNGDFLACESIEGTS